MEQTAIRIDEEVWPNAPARQWVLSFPFQVRYWLARNPELLSAVNKAVCKEISIFYEDCVAAQLRAAGQTKVDVLNDIGTGAISFVQFFNSALWLSPHLHIVFLDGGFTRAGGGKFDFTAVSGFTTELMFGVIHGIIARLELVFKDFGYVREDGEGEEPDLSEEIPLPFKPRSPKAYRRGSKSSEPSDFPNPEILTVKDWCNVHYKYFSLHAGVAIKGSDRFGLRKLIRYTSRSALSPSRLTYVDSDHPESSDVRLMLKKTWSDGTSELIFSQTALAEKMAELIPPVWFNLTRYHGIFAPGHSWRDFIVPGPKRKKLERSELDPPKPKESRASSSRAPGEYWIPWADLMRMSLGIDPEVCTCGGKFVVQDCVTDAEGIASMMAKLGLSATPPPLGKAKANDGELNYVFED
jgi:hypothetical protein